MPLLQFAGSELNPTLRLSNQWGPGPIAKLETGVIDVKIEVIK